MHGEMSSVDGEMSSMDGEMSSIDGEMSSMDGEMSFMDGEMSSMDVIHRWRNVFHGWMCHPKMSSMNDSSIRGWHPQMKMTDEGHGRSKKVSHEVPILHMVDNRTKKT